MLRKSNSRIYQGDKIMRAQEERIEIDGKYAGFKSNGKTYLQRCPKCDKENYAMNVSSGICTWCGFDANKETNQ